jgi:cell wall-associated NlpC family hydrolase
MPFSMHCQRIIALAAAAMIAAALVLVSSAAPADAAGKRRNARVVDAVKTVKRQVGDPYKYGAAGPHRFDCSGLVKFSFKRNNVPVPRTSSAQARHTKRIKRKRMRRGDLMFFHNRGSVYHVAMFVGWRNGRRQMIHASRPGVPVKRAVPWTNAWYAGTLRR